MSYNYVTWHPDCRVADVIPTIVEGNDPYSRIINTKLPPIRAKSDNGKENIYVIDRLLEKRILREKI